MSSQIKIAKPVEVSTWIAAEAASATFLDVRTNKELLDNGAFPSPFQTIPLKCFQERHLPFNKNLKVVIAGNSAEAQEAALKAISWGYSDVYVLEGGVDGWKSTGIALEKGYVRPTTHVFFEKATSTCQYIVVDEDTKDCAIIDSVLDFNPASGAVSTETADAILEFIKKWNLTVKYILETHAHADHLTASQYLKSMLDNSPPVCIGENIKLVQQTFCKVFNISIATDGSQFDFLWKDGQEFFIGSLTCKAIHTPGHTPDSMSYIIGGSIYCGDTVFLPDVGSARCDFPAGSSTSLYKSVTEKLFAFPDEYHLYIGHDYPPSESRTIPQFFTSVRLQKISNKHVKMGSSLEEFSDWRNKRDATLGAPRLLMPSLQFNIRAGHFPEPEENGTAYVKIPLKYSKGTMF